MIGVETDGVEGLVWGVVWVMVLVEEVLDELWAGRLGAIV